MKHLKQSDMSVWDEDCLATLEATLGDLQFDQLEGSGKLKLAVQDYLDIATEVSSKMGQAFQIQVEWRSEDQFVTEPWRKWRDAHAQVEMPESPSNHFPPEFRNLVVIVAKRKEGITPPDAYADE